MDPRRRTPRTLALALLIVAAGCSPRTAALRMTASLMEKGSAAFHEEKDLQLGREALAGQLKLFEALLKTEPAHPGLLRLAAEGFGAYALFLEDEAPGRARGFYLRSRDWGLKLLGRDPSLRGIETMPLEALESRLKAAGPEDVPGLFWSAYGWVGYIQLSKDSPEALADLPKAAALMRRAGELAPAYYFGGPDLFFGAYFAATPKMLGGDPARSKAHFDKAVAATGGRFLMAKVLYAQHYAVATLDRDLFAELLRQALESDEPYPEAELANAAAKARAKRLLARIDDLF